jgi:hypothetical protein
MNKPRCKSLGRLMAVTAAAALVAGCGDDPVPVGTLPAGNVVQGPVVGATVFADRTDSATGFTRNIQDSGEVAAVTDGTGAFQFAAAPSYAYDLISTGGTDSITNLPAITLRAEGGSAGSATTTNVLTPLTTLVALAPENQRESLRATIRALGVEPNARIDQGITPAAAALVKAVTTTVAQVTGVVGSASGGLPLEARDAIQTEVARSLASNLVNASNLTSAAGIAAVTRNATTSALTTLAQAPARAGGVTITASLTTVAEVAAAVAASTTTVVNAVQTAAGGTLATTAGSVKPEKDIVVASVSQAIASETSTNKLASVQQSTGITAVAPANRPPTIAGDTSRTGVVDTAFSYVPTIADPDQNTLNVTVSGSKALPPGLKLNPVTGAITGTPTAQGTGTYTLTVTDGRAQASLTVTFTFTRPTGATGATF